MLFVAVAHDLEAVVEKLLTAARAATPLGLTWPNCKSFKHVQCVTDYFGLVLRHKPPAAVVLPTSRLTKPPRTHGYFDSSRIFRLCLL